MARRGDGIYLRGRTWWLDFYHEGERHIVRLGKGINRTVARELAGVKRAAILKREAGIGRKEKSILFDKAAEEFLSWAEANRRQKTVQSYRYCIGQLKRSFSGKRLRQIYPFLIEKHKKMRVTEGARISANRELAVLKALYNRLIEWGRFSNLNPVQKVKLLKEPQKRLRYLEPEEEVRLLTEAKEPLKTIILCGIYAGLRIKSEALTLKKCDVDMRRGTLTVQAAYAKSGKTRTIPLSKLLRDALERLREIPGPYVFAKRDGTQYGSIRKAFETACERAKLADVTPHTLRHTFASRLVMAGVDLRTVQELGGWRELSMVQRYAHLSRDHKAEAIEKIAKNFPTCFTTPDKIAAAGSHLSS